MVAVQTPCDYYVMIIIIVHTIKNYLPIPFSFSTCTHMHVQYSAVFTEHFDVVKNSFVAQRRWDCWTRLRVTAV